MVGGGGGSARGGIRNKGRDKIAKVKFLKIDCLEAIDSFLDFLKVQQVLKYVKSSPSV